MQIRTSKELQLHRDNLVQQLRQLNLEILHQYHNLQQLGDPDSAELQEDLNHQNDNIARTKQQLSQLTMECEQAQKDKKNTKVTIQKFESKYAKLSHVLQQQQGQYDGIRAKNAEIEHAIKECRDHYEKLQEQIHSLDAKVDNVKKYGSQEIPQQIMMLNKQRDELRQELIMIDEQISAGKKNSNKMISRQEFKLLQQKIDELTKKKTDLSVLKEQNEILSAENETLNSQKSGYEWNPNQEMRELEENLAKEEEKISQLEREITIIYKKSSECSQKIESYQNYLEDSNNCQEEQTINNTRTSLFDELKQQIGIDEMKKVPVEAKRKQKDREKEKDSQGRTYRLNKRIQLVQLCIMIVALGILCYFCQKTYKK